MWYRKIIYKNDKHYGAILMREYRYKTNDYFHQFNKWEIPSIWVDEKKLFNATDLHYISKMNKKAIKNLH